MTTNQPEWKLIAQIGDVHPIEYGGYFIFKDETGVYEEEGEWLEAPETDKGIWRVYRFGLDRCAQVDGYLVPFRLAAERSRLSTTRNWPHPLPAYDEWFNKDLAGVAESMDIDVGQLRNWFCSADPIERASAYRTIGEHWGFDNLDSYPLRLKRAEVDARYSDLKYTKEAT
jgi:hypothetical protein